MQTTTVPRTDGKIQRCGGVWLRLRGGDGIVGITSLFLHTWTKWELPCEDSNFQSIPANRQGWTVLKTSVFRCTAVMGLVWGKVLGTVVGWFWRCRRQFFTSFFNRFTSWQNRSKVQSPETLTAWLDEVDGVESYSVGIQYSLQRLQFF